MGEPEEPDPVDTGDIPNDKVPLCTGCGRPYRRNQYYCDYCGTGVGNLTPYVPYVNIRFNYSPYGEMWRTLTSKRKASVGARVLCAVLIVLCAPIMLPGLVFVLVEWLRNRKRKPDPSPPENPAASV